MLEGFGDGSDDVKSKRLPKSHGTMNRFHDGVELHGGVSLLLSPSERVLAKGASDSLASRVASDHETRHRNVRARSGTVGSHVCCADHARAGASYDRVTR